MAYYLSIEGGRSKDFYIGILKSETLSFDDVKKDELFRYLHEIKESIDSISGFELLDKTIECLCGHGFTVITSLEINYVENPVLYGINESEYGPEGFGTWLSVSDSNPKIQHHEDDHVVMINGLQWMYQDTDYILVHTNSYNQLVSDCNQFWNTNVFVDEIYYFIPEMSSYLIGKGYEVVDLNRIIVNHLTSVDLDELISWLCDTSTYPFIDPVQQKTQPSPPPLNLSDDDLPF